MDWSFTVNVTGDDDDGSCLPSEIGDCTLREAINDANEHPGADTIDFVVSGTITLDDTLPIIASDITIDGSSQSIAVSGNNFHRVLFIGMGSLTLDNLTIENAYMDWNTYGAGIFNDGGTLIVLNSTISNNSAPTAGGIYNGGTTTILNSTISGNSADVGAGIYNDRNGTLTVINSTISGNSAGAGAGIYNGPGGTVYLTATILDTGPTGMNCTNSSSGTLNDGGYNLSDDGSCGFSEPGSLNNVALNLGSLTDNGGSTQTHLPGAGSMAINRIPAGVTIVTNGVSYTCDQNGEPLDTDQRGQPRPVNPGGYCDAGAVEASDQPGISVNGVTITEGNTGTVNAAFTISLSAGSGQLINVQYATADDTATAGIDYTTSSGTLTFNPGGALTQTITVPVVGDLLDETDETFTLTLSNPDNATISDGQSVGTITDDDDPPTVSIDDMTVMESNVGTVSATFTVTLSAPSGLVVSVQYVTANGTATAGSDYTVTSGTLTFNPGDPLTQSITVPVIGDLLDEIDEIFTLTLSNPGSATISDGQGIGTITDDDDPPTVSINDVTVTEGGAGTVNATFTVTLSAPSGLVVSVQYVTANGTATTANNDYVAASGTLTFATGTTQRSVSVAVRGDMVFETDETFFVNLSNPTNVVISDGQGQGTITNDDAAPVLAVNNPSVAENAGSGQFTVTLTPTSGTTVTVQYTIADGTAVSPNDYTATMTGTLTFNPGVTSRPIPFALVDDTVWEGNETFTVTLSDLTGGATLGTATGATTIIENEAAPMLAVNSPNVAENAGSGQFTVTLAPISVPTITVQYTITNGTATSLSDYTATITGTLSFDPGVSSQPIPFTVVDDVVWEGSETFTVTLSNPTPGVTLGTAVGTATITDNESTPVLSVNSPAVAENAGSGQFAVTLNPASATTITVQYAITNGTATSPGDYTATMAGALTFSPGLTTRPIPFTLVDDAIWEGNETFTVTLSSPNGGANLGTANGTATITENEAAPALAVNSPTVSENAGNGQFAVTLAPASAVTITVQYTIANGIATSPGDYTATGSGTLTFSPGVTSRPIPFTIVEDAIWEGSETFTATLSSPTPPGATLGTAVGTATITDNESTPVLSVDSLTMAEDAGNGQFTVTLTPVSASAITVQYTIANGTATSPGDYTATMTGTLTFNPGISSQLIPFTLVDDTEWEGDETFSVTLSGPTGGATLGTANGTFTIADSDVPKLIAPANGILTSDNTPTFIWGSVVGGVTYRIQVGDNANFGSAIIDTTVNQMTYSPVTPLVDNMRYYWRVQASSGTGSTSAWSAVWSFQVDITRLRAPIQSLPKDRSNTPDQTPTLSWGAVSGAKLYQVQWSSDPLLAGAHQGQVTTLTYTVPEQPYGVYFWRVRAQDAALRWSDWSLTRTLTITILSTPTNAQHLTDTTPAFVWKAVTGASEYHLEVYDDEALTNIVFQFIGTGTTTTASTLSEGQHWWRMQVNRGGSYGAWTPVWTFTITPPTTVAPKLTEPVSGSVQITNTPFFSWQAVMGGIRYQIQIDNNDTFASPVQDEETQPAGTLSYTASPMPDGGKFYWRVRAINSAGVAGAWSAARSFTLQQVAAPALTSPINPTTTADTTPSFTWTGVPGADTYQFQMSRTSNFAPLARQDSASSSPYTVPDGSDLPDGKYFWRVRGVTSAGVAGRWSAAWVISIDTTGPAMPVLYTPVDKAGTTDTTPAFTWLAPAGAKGYQFQLSPDPDFSGAALTPVTGLTYTVPGTSPLAYGVTYWRVQARDALGNWGAWSPARSFAVTILKTPKDGATTTDTTPVFAWAAVTGASYELQVDTSPTFNSVPLSFTYTGTALTATPSAGTPLGPDTYYWRVRVQPAGIWMPAWTLVVSPSKPAQVVLSAPASGTLTNDSTPTLSWKTATNADTYQVQIDNNGTFTSPEQDVIVGSALTSCIASELPDGVYSWRVRALNGAGAPGAWSYKRTFTVDTIPLAAPMLVAPLDDASSTNTKLILSWGAVTGAARYQLQLDPDPAFPLPVIDAGTLTTYKSPTPLSRGIYFWQVRTLDKAGNASAWSETRSFEILAGVTAPVVEPSTPLPTEPPAPTAEPAIMPTVEPTAEPTSPPDPSPLVIESDDARVQQAGIWTAHDTALASGGRYLYSSGSAEDSLSLTFEGTRLDVVYVKHPSLGTLIVEADGMPLQAVDSSAADSEFGAQVSFTLTDGVHTVRLFPLTGTIAIDAFAVETPVEPSITPTVESLPTETPPSTPEPTLTPPPTEEALPAPTATSTPIVLMLPVLETFDSGSGWMASGAWRLEAQTAHSGGGWFADSTLRGQSSTLTAEYLLDLQLAQNPELTFWQRASLTGSDVIALDLSIDGGLTWVSVDQQVGATFDWSPRTVNLAAYRGVVVTLRFRLDTLGTLAEGETTVGWWIDDLTVQEVPVVPPTPTPLPTEAPTETPLPTATPIPTELPTETPIPTIAPTETPIPTATPMPTELATPTAEPPVESPQDTGS